MEKQSSFSGIDEAVLLEAMLAAPDELIVVVNKNGYIERMSKAYGEFWVLTPEMPSDAMSVRSLRIREWILSSRLGLSKREKHRISMGKE